MTHRSGLPGGARGVSPPRVTWVVRLGDPPALGNAPYETHLTHSKYEREDVQKKTFAKWINSQLVKNGKALVTDLFADLRDGEVLLSLLEILTAQQYKRERGRMRVHHVNNVSTALRALNDAGVRLVNIAAADVVDGNPKLILGLVWSIILHWQVQYHLKELMSELHHTSLERTLLAWCRAHTQGYEGVDVTNFTSSWADGMALNALLHRWRPQLFDFHEVAQRPPNERLDHAFTLAHNYLGIDRLLDPEDVNTPNPDKKSIMMYLMCLFQSLPHSAPEPAAAEPGADGGPDSEPASPLGNTAEVFNRESGSRSRPLSTATTGSGELGGYSAALEDALAWLLDAEERLGARAAPRPGAVLGELKEHFHVHEAFLLELAAQQAGVGGALALGARLAADGALSGAEAREVRLQLRLLAERWEQLRARGMARQACVHEALMKAQQETRHEFRQWLTATEDRISKLGPLPGDTPEEVSASLAAITALHEALREQQPRVDALADCVLVLDDNEDTAGVVEMEDELRALGERWSHTCQWTLAQLARLQALRDLQPTAAEEQLKQMEANPVSTVQEVLERISTLQQIKHSVSLQQALATQHTERASALVANGEAAGVDFADVFARAEELQDRAEALLMILDVQAQRIREQGFEVELVTTQQSPMDASSTVTTTTSTVTVTSPGDARRSKKPRLSGSGGGADFQAGYKPYENWAKAAADTLEKCARDLEDSSVSRETVSGTLERLDKELSVQRQDFANVEEIQRRLATDPALKEEADQHAKIIEELKQRWDDIQRGVTSLRNTMNLLQDKDSFHRAAASLRDHLRDTAAWRDRALRDRPGHNQLIHLRNKLRALRQLDIKRKELDAQSIVLLTKPIAPAYKEEIETTARRLGTEYEELLNYLTAKEVEIKLAIGRKPQEPVKDEFENLQRKIRDIESRVIVEHVMFSPVESMENKIEELRSLRRELEELQAGYDEVVRARRQRYEAGSVQELNVRSSLENLVTKFGDTQVLLEQKIDKLENGVKLVKQLEADTTELKRGLDKLDKFLADNEFIPIGDVQLLESLLDTSNKYDEEKEKYETILNSIEKSRATILEDCDESLGKALRSDGAPTKRFLDATNRARTLNEGLRRALERTESVFRQIADTESWLKELEAQIPKEEDCRISDSAELYKVKMVFQTLKDKCDDKTQEFRNLNEAGNDMMLAAEERRPAALARRLTALSARWTDVTRGVYERYKVLAEAWHETGELRAWLAQEAAWLDGLERRLRSRHQPADAEELSAQLYDLESYMRNHSSLRLSRIQDVGRQLADAHIMAGWIRAEIHALQDRWNTLQAEAMSRTATLERAAREAAQCEVAAERLQQWLRRAQARLRDADDGDHQELVEQVETQRESLKEIETQVEAYRAAARPEAAERLQHQLDLLRHQLEECVERLSTLGTPEASEEDDSLEGRLSRAMRTLRAVQTGADRELALSSAQPDAVRAVLRRCLKFYRTLSEIKSEVESVIKTGRKMAEDEDGRELSPRIDALKELYNRLGAQVTESKTRLENALLTAREIHNDLGALGTWLDGLGAGVGRQTLELEMSRMEAIKDKLNANHREYAKSCDPASLAELREQVDEINARWERLKKHGVTKDESSPQKFLDDVARELTSQATLTDAKLRALDGELRARASDIRATNDPALVKQLDKLISDVEAPRGYERVSDTVKRRLESPAPAPAPAPQPKRSRIPLALHSPVPVRRELQQRERAVSAPTTPDPPRRDSSTFNLLADSDLFTQISRGKVEVERQKVDRPKAERPKHVVAVREREIVKATISPVEPELIPGEEALHFVPRRAEVVEVVDDTVEPAERSHERRPSVDLGTEPKTFVVEVKTLEHRMKPTLGILKRRSADDTPKSVKISMAAPDVIPSLEPQEGTNTPPPTPMDGAVVQCPLMFDLSLRQHAALLNLRRDEVNEYLILDEVPREQPALPEPSATGELATHVPETTPEEKESVIKDADKEEPVESPERVATDEKVHEIPQKSPSSPEEVNEIAKEQPEVPHLEDKSSDGAEEVIYSEVEDMPQSAARNSAELPLCTSTPLKEMQMDVQPKRERDSKSPSPRRSHIPLSRERLRLHTERLQGSEPESPPLSPVSAGSRGSPPLSPLSPLEGTAPDSLLGALGAAPDEELEEYEAAATAAARRMDVMMVTVGAVDAEKDPGKRLEILKHQLGALAPEAAALISRGDSLVYARHAASPLLAEYVRTHSDRLRNKWAQVMAEIEAKRNVAIRAEDNIKELNTLLESLQRWLKRLEGDIKAERGLVKEEFLDREGDVERVSELCRALRAARVGYPERAVADLGQAWTRARQLYEATHKPKRDKKGKIDASEALCGEYVTRANRCRERVAAVARSLQAPPLGTRDYDEFPLQEDALAKVKSSISELEAVVAETESVFTSLNQQPSDNAQATRVRRKLQTEWTALKDNYKERRERWTRCQAEWAALYAALEACGAWLDNAERSLQQARSSQEPLKDLKQKLRDLEQQMTARASAVSAARAGGRAVLGACGGALARGVQDQLEQLLARWLKAAADLQALQHKRPLTCKRCSTSESIVYTNARCVGRTCWARAAARWRGACRTSSSSCWRGGSRRPLTCKRCSTSESIVYTNARCVGRTCWARAAARWRGACRTSSSSCWRGGSRRPLTCKRCSTSESIVYTNARCVGRTCWARAAARWRGACRTSSSSCWRGGSRRPLTCKRCSTSESIVYTNARCVGRTCWARAAARWRGACRTSSSSCWRGGSRRPLTCKRCSTSESIVYTNARCVGRTCWARAAARWRGACRTSSSSCWRGGSRRPLTCKRCSTSESIVYTNARCVGRTCWARAAARWRGACRTSSSSCWRGGSRRPLTCKRCSTSESIVYTNARCVGRTCWARAAARWRGACRTSSSSCWRGGSRRPLTCKRCSTSESIVYTNARCVGRTCWARAAARWRGACRTSSSSCWRGGSRPPLTCKRCSTSESIVYTNARCVGRTCWARAAARWRGACRTSSSSCWRGGSRPPLTCKRCSTSESIVYTNARCVGRTCWARAAARWRGACRTSSSSCWRGGSRRPLTCKRCSTSESIVYTNARCVGRTCWARAAARWRGACRTSSSSCWRGGSRPPLTCKRCSTSESIVYTNARCVGRTCWARAAARWRGACRTSSSSCWRGGSRPPLTCKRCSTSESIVYTNARCVGRTCWARAAARWRGACRTSSSSCWRGGSRPPLICKRCSTSESIVYTNARCVGRTCWARAAARWRGACRTSSSSCWRGGSRPPLTCKRCSTSESIVYTNARCVGRTCWARAAARWRGACRTSSSSCWRGGSRPPLTCKRCSTSESIVYTNARCVGRTCWARAAARWRGACRTSSSSCWRGGSRPPLTCKRCSTSESIVYTNARCVGRTCWARAAARWRGACRTSSSSCWRGGSRRPLTCKRCSTSESIVYTNARCVGRTCWARAAARWRGACRTSSSSCWRGGSRPPLTCKRCSTSESIVYTNARCVGRTCWARAAARWRGACRTSSSSCWRGGSRPPLTCKRCSTSESIVYTNARCVGRTCWARAAARWRGACRTSSSSCWRGGSRRPLTCKRCSTSESIVYTNARCVGRTCWARAAARWRGACRTSSSSCWRGGSRPPLTCKRCSTSESIVYTNARCVGRTCWARAAARWRGACRTSSSSCWRGGSRPPLICKRCSTSESIVYTNARCVGRTCWARAAARWRGACRTSSSSCWRGGSRPPLTCKRCSTSESIVYTNARCVGRTCWARAAARWRGACRTSSSSCWRGGSRPPLTCKRCSTSESIVYTNARCVGRTCWARAAARWRGACRTSSSSCWRGGSRPPLTCKRCSTSESIVYTNARCVGRTCWARAAARWRGACRTSSSSCWRGGSRPPLTCKRCSTSESIVYTNARCVGRTCWARAAARWRGACRTSSSSCWRGGSRPPLTCKRCSTSESIVYTNARCVGRTCWARAAARWRGACRTSSSSCWRGGSRRPLTCKRCSTSESIVYTNARCVGRTCWARAAARWRGACRTSSSSCWRGGSRRPLTCKRCSTSESIVYTNARCVGRTCWARAAARWRGACRTSSSSCWRGGSRRPLTCKRCSTSESIVYTNARCVGRTCWARAAARWRGACRTSSSSCWRGGSRRPLTCKRCSTSESIVYTNARCVGRTCWARAAARWRGACRTSSSSCWRGGSRRPLTCKRCSTSESIVYTNARCVGRTCWARAAARWRGACRTSSSSCWRGGSRRPLTCKRCSTSESIVYTNARCVGRTCWARAAARWRGACRTSSSSCWRGGSRRPLTCKRCSTSESIVYTNARCVGRTCWARAAARWRGACRTSSSSCWRGGSRRPLTCKRCSTSESIVYTNARCVGRTCWARAAARWRGACRTSSSSCWRGGSRRPLTCKRCSTSESIVYTNARCVGRTCWARAAARWRGACRTSSSSCWRGGSRRPLTCKRCSTSESIVYTNARCVGRTCWARAAARWRGACRTSSSSCWRGGSRRPLTCKRCSTSESIVYTNARCVGRTCWARAAARWRGACRTSSSSCWRGGSRRPLTCKRCSTSESIVYTNARCVGRTCWARAAARWRGACRTSSSSCWRGGSRRPLTCKRCSTSESIVYTNARCVGRTCWARAAARWRGACRTSSSSCWRGGSRRPLTCKRCSTNVLGACGGALARGVQDQLEQLLARWLKAAADLQALQHKVSSLETSRDSPRDAEESLAGVRALLDTTSANPSDRTSLSVRLSLVKARSEELGARLQDAGPMQAQVQQACAALGAHRDFLSQKLAALGKFAARLDAAAARVQAARARLSAAPQDPAAVAEVQELISSQETEVREVLENYNNLERECGAARQAVAPALRERAAGLRQDWAALRGHELPTVVSETPRRGSDTPGERKGSVDSQASDWSGRASGRRRSAHSQAPAVLLAHFDTTVSQIREWVSCETEMLRAQAVAVGDVDDILNQLDKQKGVLRELEQKKPQLDELLHTAESLKGTENRQQLHGKVTALREHWDEANARVLQRKAQLDAMLGDSQRYEARRRDADAWLTRMEARLAAMAQPGHTADVLEMQLREQKVR
ncbi:uncharacterized protein LOC134748000 [Cydia strobilella]|uniref:uncharacterized protein LOC134748000 n=1 Tax=Cydia strobilella TaxID=1100964 RepID=UPI003006C384